MIKNPPKDEVAKFVTQPFGFDPSQPLTNTQQETFALAFAKYPNASDAARKSGYSTHSASRMGLRVRKMPHVQSRIDYLRRSSGWTKERVNVEINEGYERIKKETDLGWMKERREWIQLMCNLMGYTNQNDMSINIEIHEKVTSILGEFSKRLNASNTNGSKAIDNSNKALPDSNLIQVKSNSDIINNINNNQVKLLQSSEGGEAPSPSGSKGIPPR